MHGSALAQLSNPPGLQHSTGKLNWSQHASWSQRDILEIPGTHNAEKVSTEVSLTNPGLSGNKQCLQLFRYPKFQGELKAGSSGSTQADAALTVVSGCASPRKKKSMLIFLHLRNNAKTLSHYCSPRGDLVHILWNETGME